MVAQLLTTAFGVWLTAAPDLLNYDGPAATHDHIIGPIIASCTFVAVWEVMGGLRWIDVALGGWLLFAPWLLGYAETATIFNSVIVGIAVMGLSLRQGTVTQRFGGGWAALLPRRQA